MFPVALIMQAPAGLVEGRVEGRSRSVVQYNPGLGICRCRLSRTRSCSPSISSTRTSTAIVFLSLATRHHHAACIVHTCVTACPVRRTAFDVHACTVAAYSGMRVAPPFGVAVGWVGRAESEPAALHSASSYCIAQPCSKSRCARLETRHTPRARKLRFAFNPPIPASSDERSTARN